MKENRRGGRVLTALEAKSLDRKAAGRFGISTLLLMENAGRSVSEEALKVLKRLKNTRVAVFCGRGNNGGDGFCAARHLRAAGVKPDVYLCGEISGVKKEAGINLGILLRLKQKVNEACSSAPDLKKAGGYGLIIDALLGVGLRAGLKPLYREFIDAINSSGAYVLSVDIPSGLDATSGRTGGACVKADKTVTFVAKKQGMLSKEGRKHCGEVLVRGIGVGL